MNNLYVGYASTNINPPLGISVAGYYVPRYAKGFLDDLEASATVIAAEDKKAVIVSVDHCGLDKKTVAEIVEAAEKRTGISKDNMFIHSTHTHTGPSISLPSFPADAEQIETYRQFLVTRVADVIELAAGDLKPARMGYITGYAPERVAYIRRYKMKDGTTWTCPPIDDPNIDHPIGVLDQRVNVVRFDREGAQTVVIVNYGLHSDTINGELISADWPGWMRKTLDKALDGVKCVFLNGCEGDVGSTNVHPKDGDMNDTEISFDNEMKSPGMARFVGRAIAGTVLQVYDKVKYVDVDSIDMIKRTAKIAANVPKPEDMPRAKEYKKLHESGRDDLIPYTAMELTTVVAEALRMCKHEFGPEYFDLELCGIRLGEIALLGIPGEPFTDIGVGIKESRAFALTLPCALVNGSEGYFPMQSAFDEGGYEARTSRFKAGVAENIIKEGKALLEELKNR